MADEERRDLESEDVQQDEATPTEVEKEASGEGPSESAKGRMTLKEILHLGEKVSLFKPPSHNPIWSFYWPSLGDQVERIERLFVDMLRRRHPDVEIEKADIAVPTHTQQGRVWSKEDARQVKALWIGRSSEHQDDLYFVKAVLFHPFGEGITVERYDLTPVRKRLVDPERQLWGILVLGLGILSMLFAFWVATDAPEEESIPVCLGIGVIALLLGTSLLLSAHQPWYYFLWDHRGTEDKVLKDAVDHALRDALDSVGIAVPEDLIRGLKEGESPTIL